MARRSAFEHLKDLVLAEFKHGKQPKDLYAKYSEIPPKTIRNWFEYYLPPDSPFKRPNHESDEEQGFSNAHPPSGSRSLTLIEGGEDDETLPDLQWVKRKAKGIVRTEKNNAIKIQALNTFLRAVQIEFSKPQEIKAQLQVDFDEMSDEELEKLASGGDVDKVAKAG